MSQELHFLHETKRFVWGSFQPSLPQKGVVLIDDGEHLGSGLRLHDSVINVENCLFLPNQWVEMNRHQTTKEIR